MKRLSLLLVALFILIIIDSQDRLNAQVAQLSASICYNLFGISNGNVDFQEDEGNCRRDKSRPNLMLLGGVYCYNNGTGICKAFAGQFEFYFNVWQDKIIGPAPKSQYVSAEGMHSRVPVSYNIDGRIIYADQSINWANQYKLSIQSKKFALLSINEFNWCAFAGSDWWPYKSAVKDYHSQGRFHIYFYNKQSCIYETQTKNRQHFNTRFLGNSSLRIDLDNNPLIFAMEDDIAGEVRLVKNKRQHWYEVPFRTVKYGQNDIRYFVEMSANEKLPCRINGTAAPLLSRRAFRRYTNMCLEDSRYRRKKNEKNSPTIQNYCGTEEIEIADYPIVYSRHINFEGQVIEVDLHNLPKHPRESEKFYGVDYENDEDWYIFASHGLSFTATTTIPIGDSLDKVRVISLYNDFRDKADNKYDEDYPRPMISDFTAYFNDGEWNIDERDRKAKHVKNLNYVDDIAYLYRCDTVLIIFGPIYTEIPASQFSIRARAPLGSISDLGAYEMINAAFADPAKGSDALYFYHRLNYVSLHRYTCAAGGSGLVTAAKDGPYRPRWGPGQHSIFKSDPYYAMDYAMREESLFQQTGVLKGDIGEPDAPNPVLYKGNYDDPAMQDSNSILWLWILFGVGACICVTMCLICVISIRRRRGRKKEKIPKSNTSATLSKRQTARSSHLTQSTDAGPSVRSSLLRSVTPPPPPASTTSDKASNRSTASSPPAIRSHQEAYSLRNLGKSVSRSKPNHPSVHNQHEQAKQPFKH